MLFRVPSFVEDEKRRHDDVSRLLRWVRILPIEQTKVDDCVQVTQIQLNGKKTLLIQPCNSNVTKIKYPKLES